MDVISRWFVPTLLVGVLGVAAAAQEARVDATPASDRELASILKRVGESVERYHAGMFSLRFTETWRWEELSKEFAPKETREFVYDDFVVREEMAGAEGNYFGKIVRRLRTANGQPARAGRSERMEPAPTAHAFLTFLLPAGQQNSVFTLEGEETYGGRRCFRLGHHPRQTRAPGVVWEGRSFKVFGPMAGRLWVDAENFDVLAWELRLTEPVEFDSPRAFKAGPFGRFGPSRKLRYVRDDYTVRFRRVEFRGPAQTLLLPESAEWVRVIEGASRPRVRITQTFTDYRRFVSDVKVIEEF